MTAVMEPISPAMAAAFAELARQQAQFDATRPPCPTWCTDDCADNHDGTVIHHRGDEVPVSSTSEAPGGGPSNVTVRSWRADELNEPSEAGIELDTVDANWLFTGVANFTPEQARALAAELLRQADLVQPEYEVSVQQVRIGDWIQVDNQWMEVYCVLADEAADNVQISVSADPENWSDFDYRDENPEHFALDDTIRVRRHTPTGGTR